MAQIEARKNQNKPRNTMWKLMKKLREDIGIPQSEVAERLGIRQEAVAQWERENGNPPGMVRLPALAKIYQVELSVLEDARKNASQVARSIRLPDLDFDYGLRSHVHGFPLPCLDTVEPNDLITQILLAIRDPNILWRVVSTPCDTRSFFFKMDNDSMEPLIAKDAWVAFDPVITPKDQNIVLIYRKDATTVTWMIRMLRIEGDQKVLTGATRSTWPPRNLDDKDQIIAVAIEAHSVFPR
ncbi:LexA family transcriptional regulator [Acidithiobacillus thiooxidans]|uniref:LexA family transcriptional regulator n=1 Tax=Acidithiobacillus thiooxidans TaxID=930 RepID=UPI0028615E1F|nr:LexA family transcriptional regulator [Acidithiobacillus thiooxidans]MDD2749510.1 LexA family transcriptional regulator [Acidithiobacillus sp.]MDR7927098.1 LexA family transcriptional regulator [Acidithiobacillus thiooxidans]